jgi:rod shape-determining protein MreC
VRLAWFKNLNPIIQIFVLCGLILSLLVLNTAFAKYLKPGILSLLSAPLKYGQGISSQARGFFAFQDLVAENKELKQITEILRGQLVQVQEIKLENQRLRNLLSLPENEPYQTRSALIIGKDSSNWTRTILINKGKSSAVKTGMPVVLGENLVGKVLEAGPNISKVMLIVDFNSKVPAKILRTREEGLVFGSVRRRGPYCKMKYIQGEVKIGDQVISSGLGGIYPKGLLIGQVVAVEEERNKLYRLAVIEPAVDLSSLEEVTVIID